jgi:hypothetical protein
VAADDGSSTSGFDRDLAAARAGEAAALWNLVKATYRGSAEAAVALGDYVRDSGGQGPRPLARLLIDHVLGALSGQPDPGSAELARELRTIDKALRGGDRHARE